METRKMKKYPTPFKWTNCKLCGLFRECDDVIPPEHLWKKLTPNELLTTKRYVCFNCKKIELSKHHSWYSFQDLVYDGFENELEQTI